MLISDLFEVGSIGELDVSEKLQRYFTDRGYTIAGEGRDQMVFHRPGQRHVIKVIGLGDDLARRDNVADYVRFFAMNQNNPHFPRVSPPREIQVGDEIYTVYRQELLQSLPGEEEVMDWMEKFGGALSDPAHARAWVRENPPPSNLPAAQIQGLYRAVRRLQQFYGDDLGGSIKMDLGHVGNFMQRADGTIVVVDPLAYDESYDTYSESADEDEGFIMRLTDRLSYPEIVNRISGMMRAMGWRGKRKGDDDYVFMTRGQLEDEWYTVTIGKTVDGKGFTYALGTIEDGNPHIGQQETMPNTVASISMLADEIRDGFSINENFADGRVKGKSRPGRVKRSGASCKGSVTDLRARAKKYGGERGRMYHWCANMKGGRKK